MANSLKNIVPSKITLLSFTLFLLLLLLFPLDVNSFYDILAVNCGHSIDTVFENRTWVGDIDDTKLFSIIEPHTEFSSVKTKAIPNFDLVKRIPFSSARLSFSNFTVSFPSSVIDIDGVGNTVFLRLHFYPTSYQNFETSNALFTVKLGNNITLLKDFKPLLWLQNDNKTITKEYCITKEPGENLTITFIPNIKNQPNAYAFINGIEIVSMPSFLYYTNPSDPYYHLNFLSLETTNYQILNDKALETVYRVNVGPNQVPPNYDTGMFRDWENDYPRYLEKEYPSSVPSDFAHNLTYLNNTIPEYTAPEAVYLTARSYGLNVTEDYIVTWNFEVDSSFTYMVRLHFCEFDRQVKNRGDRVFQIFIDDILAEGYADVIWWSGGNMIPVYKDYDVSMKSLEGSFPNQRVNLSIKLQRLPNTNTRYRDVILNGIEIFKISDKNNLAGQISKFIELSPPHQEFSTQSSKKFKITTAFAVVIAVSSLVLAIVVGIIVSWLRRRFHNAMADNLLKTKNIELPSLLPHLCRYFTIAEIKAASGGARQKSLGWPPSRHRNKLKYINHIKD